MIIQYELLNQAQFFQNVLSTNYYEILKIQEIDIWRNYSLMSSKGITTKEIKQYNNFRKPYENKKLSVKMKL